MIVVFEKGTNKLIGKALQVYDTGSFREFTPVELYPDLDHSKLGYFYAEDNMDYIIRPERWQWKLDGGGNPIGIEPRPWLSLKLSTTAPDGDGDGLYELVAQGKKAATALQSAVVQVQVMDGEKTSNAQVKVMLSTTGGSLSSRILTTDGKGQASATLTSGSETVTITVTASGENMDGSSITFEVLPESDYHSIHGLEAGK
jgi:hypothetical protein